MLKKAVIVTLLVLLLDQSVKFWVKTHMYLGQEFHVFGDWFIIHFTENNGMAFGMELAGNFGKLFLSLFRIAAVSVIGWYLYRLARREAPAGLVICLALIFAGAMGNIIDSAFYGLIFSDSLFDVASLFPASGGYGGFLHGKVVDMFYFPLLSGQYPAWMPFLGGDEFIFFRPVFNVADAAISIGVIALLIFQKRFFADEAKVKIV